MIFYPFNAIANQLKEEKCVRQDTSKVRVH